MCFNGFPQMLFLSSAFKKLSLSCTILPMPSILAVEAREEALAIPSELVKDLYFSRSFVMLSRLPLFNLIIIIS